MSKSSVRYLVFDLESVADAALVAKLRYPGEQIEPATAVRRYRDELLAKYETDFIPYTFQVPVSVVVAKVAADFSLVDLVALDEPEFRPHVITEHFWRGWEAYRRPTLVSFNGRTFDVPLLELAAFRFGLSLPGWFSGTKAYEQPRNRYNSEAHLDLHDVLTNHGASRFNGGLNLAANLLGKPGKMDVQGYMVQDLWNEGRLAEINDLRVFTGDGPDGPTHARPRTTIGRPRQVVARSPHQPNPRLRRVSRAMGELDESVGIGSG